MVKIKENPGTGTVFLSKLKAYREKYPLAPKVGALPPVPPGHPADRDSEYLRELLDNGNGLTFAEIDGRLSDEQQGEKRPAILTVLRQLYINAGLPQAKKSRWTKE